MADFATEDEHYSVALADLAETFRILRPPARISVAEGAAKTLMIKRPGDAAQLWNPHKTPYMIKPMNLLASTTRKAVCFVGPAQSGKTAALGEGWISHAVANDPGDMMVVQMTEAKAREYSRQRIDRMLLNSPKLKALQSLSKRDDNTHDKGFIHGMQLKLAWPTVTNLSSTSYRYVFVTDLDRMDDDIDGEGDVYSLALARVRTFNSRGMVCVESSPGRAWEDVAWKPATPHEAPPVKGILGIYNGSDRQRWYWQCPDCNEHFEAAPGIGLFGLPDESELMEDLRTADIGSMVAHFATVKCVHCKSPLPFEHRHHMNSTGIWLPDGQRLTKEREIVGTATTSTVAGFWLGGVAAAWQPWTDLLSSHLEALKDYSMTGSELKLQVAVNTGQSMPYMSRHLIEGKGVRRSATEKAERSLQRYVVPDQTRCVIVSIDVQGGSTARFVVQAHAIGPNNEEWLIDRYDIKDSEREGMAGPDSKAPIDPAGYAEDWDVLTKQVVMSTYRTSDKGREIRPKAVVVDTGGEGDQNGGEGVSHNAYAWFRTLRKLGVSARVVLYKGASAKTAPIIKEVRVGKRNGKDIGDIPLFMCNPHLLSDEVSASLKRDKPGPGYIHFPEVKHPIKNPDGWVPQAFFDELTAEVRDKNGTWRKIRKRNETFDLCRMVRCGILRLGLNKVNWDAPPDWLLPLDQNSDCMSPEERRDMKEQMAIRIAELRGQVQPVARASAAPRQRRAISLLGN